MNAMEVGDKITPTPLLMGDLVRISDRPCVWEVNYTRPAYVHLVSPGGATRFIGREQIAMGILKRADGSPIDPEWSNSSGENI